MLPSGGTRTWSAWVPHCGKRHVLLATIIVALLLINLLLPSLTLVPRLLVYYPSLLLPRDDAKHYTFHHVHDHVPPGLRFPRKYVPHHCPAVFSQPSNIHYLVINMDRSPERLALMVHAFQQLGLPPFQRIRGVDVLANKEDIDIPRGVRAAIDGWVDRWMRDFKRSMLLD